MKNKPQSDDFYTSFKTKYSNKVRLSVILKKSKNQRCQGNTYASALIARVIQTTTCTNFTSVSALWTELKPKGLSLLELRTKRSFVVISLKVNLFFHIGNAICLYSDRFTPHFPPLLNILEGILILQFFSKGIFKLEITYFCSYWHGRKHVLYNSSRKLKQENILGSNSQHSELANTSRKLFIYHLLRQFFLHSFSSIFSTSTAAVSFVFLSLCSWFRKKSPFPSVNSRSSKVCVSCP